MDPNKGCSPSWSSMPLSDIEKFLEIFSNSSYCLLLSAWPVNSYLAFLPIFNILSIYKSVNLGSFERVWRAYIALVASSFSIWASSIGDISTWEFLFYEDELFTFSSSELIIQLFNNIRFEYWYSTIYTYQILMAPVALY